MEERTCIKCKKKKPIKSFAQAGKDPRYRRRSCNSCRGGDRSREYYKANKEAIAQRAKSKRVSQPAKTLLRDARKTDKKKGFTNDLDVEFIRGQLTLPCKYCGGICRTLDRIDNTKGHLKSNVNPACLRCNYTRKDMPYEAWLVVADGMRNAFAAGLFGDWTGRARKPSANN